MQLARFLNKIFKKKGFILTDANSKEFIIGNPEQNPIKLKILDKKGVSTRPGTQAVHMLHYYKKKYKIKDKDLSNSKYCYENTMAIPLYNGITKRELSFIVKCIKEIN